MAKLSKIKVASFFWDTVYSIFLFNWPIFFWYYFTYK